MDNHGVRLDRREFANALPGPVVLMAIGIMITPVASNLPYFDGFQLWEGGLMTVAFVTGVSGFIIFYRNIVRRFRDAGLNASLACLPLFIMGALVTWSLIYPWIQSIAAKKFVAQRANETLNMEIIHQQMSGPINEVTQVMGAASIAMIGCVLLICILCPTKN